MTGHGGGASKASPRVGAAALSARPVKEPSARGEIDVDEYRQRLQVLGGAQSRGLS